MKQFGSFSGAAAPRPSDGSDPRRAEWIQRMQVGGVGLALTICMIALANVVIERASNEEPVTAATSEDTSANTAMAEPLAEPSNSEPLVDLGVVPDLPAENAIQPDASQQKVQDLEPRSNINNPSAAPANGNADAN